MQRLRRKDNIENGYLSAVKKELFDFTPVHCHEFYEIEYFISGDGTYTIDGITYPIAAGSFFFMTPLNTHTVATHQATVYNLMFSGDMASTSILAQLAFTAPIIQQADSACDLLFTALLDEMIAQQNNRSFASLLLDTLLLKLCHSTGGRAQPGVLSPVQQAQLYILDHLRAELSLHYVADRFGFSPSYFSKLFAQEAGKSFKSYISGMRFDLAKKLLTQTSMTVAQVCAECGFRDYPNFIRRFTQHTGMAPSAYRQQHT